ncbi:MAG: ComEC/Rec2 family competence protein [Minisyncoccia bacterium]
MKDKNLLTPAQIFRKSGISFLLGIFSYYLFLKIGFWFLFVFLLFVLISKKRIKEFFNSSGYFYLFLIFYFLGFSRPFYSFHINIYPEALISFSLKLKEFINNQFLKFFSLNEKEILTSLLFGAKGNLSLALKSKIQKVGLAHLVAVSGFHLSFLNQGLSFFLQEFFNLNIRWLFPILIFFNLIFVATAQFTPSVIRSAIMAFFSSLASFNYRFYHPSNALLATLILMLFYNPSFIFDVSFQLSFLATIGILYFAPLIENLFSQSEEIFLEESFFLKIKKFLLKVLILNFSSFLTTFPLVIYHFSNLSLVSPLVNLLVLPLIPYIMGLSIPFIFFSSFSFYLGLVFVLLLKILLNYFFFIINTFSQLPFASIDFSLFWRYISLAFYFFVLYFYIWLKKKNELKIKKLFQ